MDQINSIFLVKGMLVSCQRLFSREDTNWTGTLAQENLSLKNL